MKIPACAKTYEGRTVLDFPGIEVEQGRIYAVRHGRCSGKGHGARDGHCTGDGACWNHSRSGEAGAEVLFSIEGFFEGLGVAAAVFVDDMRVDVADHF